MTGQLEPNDEGTVCCVCLRPIVPHVDARYTLYEGKESRHYRCSAPARMKEATKGAKEALDAAYDALDKLRRDRGK